MRELTRTSTNTRSEAGGSPLKVLTLTWRPWRLPLWRLNVKSSAKEFRFAMLIKTLIKNFFTTGGSLFGGCTVFDLPPQTRALFLQVSYTASNCLSRTSPFTSICFIMCPTTDWFTESSCASTTTAGLVGNHDIRIFAVTNLWWGHIIDIKIFHQLHTRGVYSSPKLSFL